MDSGMVDEGPSSLSHHHRWFIELGRTSAILVLGIVLPLVLMIGSLLTVWRLESVTSKEDITSFFKRLPSNVATLGNGNDYRLASVLFLESSNAQVMESRQRSKVAVVNIGFAVMSLGLAFVLLGIDDGGIETEGENSGVRVKLVVASSGLAVFVIGALLSGGAALIPVGYHTPTVPDFADYETQTVYSEPASVEESQTAVMIQACLRSKTATREEKKQCVDAIIDRKPTGSAR